MSARETMAATWRTCGSLPGARFSALMWTPRRRLQVPLRDRADPRRHGRRKQRRLARGRRGVEERFEILREAHVEHLVGFVEHEHLERLERQRLAAQVIERAAGRRHDDVRAALRATESAGPSARRRTPAPRSATCPSRTCGSLRRPASPARASARGSARAPRRLRRAGRRDQPVEQRQRESRGLAGAGAGLADQVLAGQQQRESPRAGSASAPRSRVPRRP